MVRKKILFILLLVLFASCGEEESTENPKIQNSPESNKPPGCLAVDTDGDGIINCLDPDMDNDGVLNEDDAFPLDPFEWEDSDGDGYGDNSDEFPNDPTEWFDTDGDGVGNNADPDDDNDGVPDLFEYPRLNFDETEWFDIDGDRLGDTNIDPDKDNDGVPNVFDDLSWNRNVFFDIDNDIIGNREDDDMDGDGVLNIVDAFPYDATEWIDTDLDRLGNNIDPDDDNDGFPDSWEEFPLDREKMFDTDGDGFSNNEDAFPFDPNEWVDTDGDGVGDNSDPFPSNSSEWADTDDDGIGDNSDPDIDGDGFINCIPVDSTNPSCNKDAFPFDRTEWLDSDGDGIGNNADPDDDNDGVPDVFDDFALDASHHLDFSKDGIPDSTMPRNETEEMILAGRDAVYFIYDPDVDNDGVPNVFDTLAWNRLEWADIDGDGIGNNADPDIDGDGVPNNIDLFPYNEEESGDFDRDGIGDNSDPDDDNDGSPDVFDELPNNRNGFSDLDGNGVPDQIDNDIDGDGRGNGEHQCEDQGAQIVCGYPFSQDLFIWDPLEWADDDEDGIGNNADPDDDNDGAPDVFDEFPFQPDNIFDIDGDGVANRMDEDIDGDGTFAPLLECNPDGINIVCAHPREECEMVESLDNFDQVVMVEVCEQFDHFPYNPLYDNDLDGDRIPNELDEDIDGDGVINCVPLTDYDDPASCNQDQLPFVGPNHPFVEDIFSEFGDEAETFLIEADYCFDKEDFPNPEDRTCWYTYSDRDGDGLSDFEEWEAGTNPEDSDSDGDGVSDKIEIDQGTDPKDAEDFLDTDADGIHDALDPTPKGVFDEVSLRQQFQTAGNCTNNTSELSCEDNQTNLCFWEEDPQVPNSGVCRSRPMILTQDIQLTDCIPMVGEVNLVGKSGDARYSLEFPQTASGGSSCDPSEFALMTMDQDSSVSFEKIDIKAEFVPRVIRSLGDELSLKNVSIIGKDINLMTLVDYNNVANGNFTMTKSTLRSSAITGAGNEPTNTLLSAVKVSSIDMNLSGNIVECNLNTRIPESSNYNCINTDGNNSVFEGNVFANLDFNTNENVNNTYTHNHVSLNSLDYSNSRIYSYSQALNITSNSSTINLDEETTRVSNLNELGTYRLDGSNESVNSPPNLIDVNSLFTTEESNTLACVKQNSADLATIHGAYFSPDTVQNYWNFTSIEIIDGDATNLTPEGTFDTSSDFAFWENPLGTSGLDLGEPLFGDGGTYNESEGYIVLDSENSSSGIGRNFDNLDLSKSYKLKFNPRELNPGDNENLYLEVIIRRTDSGEPIRVVTITFGENSDVVTNEGVSIEKQILFGEELFELDFTIDDPDISITIGIPTFQGEATIIDDIELLQSSNLTFQYPGVEVGICKEEE